MLRSALRWLQIDQNDQIAASSMCSCTLLACSGRRPAGAETLADSSTRSRWNWPGLQLIAQDVLRQHRGLASSWDLARRTNFAGYEQPALLPLATRTRQSHTLNHRAHRTQEATPGPAASQPGLEQHWMYSSAAEQRMQLGNSGVGGVTAAVQN